MGEIQQMVDLWDRADFDLPHFISMVVRENEPKLIRESLYPIRQLYYTLLKQAAEDVIKRCRKISPFRREPLPRGLYYVGQSGIQDCSATSAGISDRSLAWNDGAVQVAMDFARIFPDGGVQLCYKFTVGNLHEEAIFPSSFNRLMLAILFGSEVNTFLFPKRSARSTLPRFRKMKSSASLG